MRSRESAKRRHSRKPRRSSDFGPALRDALKAVRHTADVIENTETNPRHKPSAHAKGMRQACTEIENLVKNLAETQARTSDDPDTAARRKHKAHPGNGAIWNDCVECNPLASESYFLSEVRNAVRAGINVLFAATNTIEGPHPWLLLDDEIVRRIKGRKALNDASLEAEKLIGERVVNIGVRSVALGDPTSCVSCGGRAQTVLELGKLGRDAVRLCRDCMSALDGALTTHFGNGKRSQ